MKKYTQYTTNKESHRVLRLVLVILLAVVTVWGAVASFRHLTRTEASTAKNEQNHNHNHNHNISARLWHVSPDGNDDNDGATAEKPLATIQKALRHAHPGDTIILADGDYLQSAITVRGGIKGHPIVVRGTPNAIMRGSEDKGRILEVHHDHITLEGFTIDGQHGEGKDKDDYRDKLIYALGQSPGKGVEYLRIIKMQLQNAGGECVRLRYFAAHNEIRDSVIKNCGIHDFRFKEGGKNGEAIYIGTAPEQRDDGKNPNADADRSHNNWIHHNQIETNGNECVDIKEAATDNLVEHNTCSNQLDAESGGMDSRGSGNIFRRNIIFNNKGAGVRLGGDGSRDGINNDVYENELRNNQAGAMKIMRNPQGRVCGNTVSGNGAGQDEEARGVDPSKACR